MKNITIIWLGLLCISGPKQKFYECRASVPAKLQSYWIIKAKKELLRAQPNPIVQGLQNTLHFIPSNGIKKIFPHIAD